MGSPLSTLPIPKLLARYAIPAILALWISSLYSIVDQIFLGHRLGYLANAACAIIYPFSIFSLALALLFGVGAAASFSLNLGKGNKEKAREFVFMALYASLGLSLLYLVLSWLLLPQLLSLFGVTKELYAYAFDYSRILILGFPGFVISSALNHLIQADGSPGYALAVNVSGAITNIVLDYVFLFVLNQGMAGAALATILGQDVSLLLCLIYLARFKSLRLNFKQPARWNQSVFLAMIQFGLSPALTQVCLLIAQIVLNGSLAFYGARSMYGAEAALAGAGLGLKLNMLCINVMSGLAQSLQPIVGFNYGAKKFERVKETIRLAIGWLLASAVLIELIFQLFPKACLEIFGAGSEQSLAFGVLFLRIYLGAVGIMGLQPLAANFFTSIGQPLKGILLTCSRQLFFFVPLVLLLPRFLSLLGVLAAEPAADVLSAALSLALLYQELKKMPSGKSERGN